MRPLPGDLVALVSGGKAALARALSGLEASPEDAEIVALLEAAWAAPRGVTLGLTGPPGVGKSTLTSALVARLRACGETVAVIAVDPSSRSTGGALLGDRIRIETDPDDIGVFVRSMAARRRLGGLAEAVFPAVVLMRSLFDWVLVETVGVGQSETEIADCADLVTFCVQPGSGDSLQFMKAGVMEVPDLVLVTKGDMGASAARAAADVKGALSLGSERAPQVCVVSARTGEGMEAALKLIADGRRGVDDLSARRAEQARAWAIARLTESFGRVGVDALAERIDADHPFESLAAISKRARVPVYQVLKNI